MIPHTAIVQETPGAAVCPYMTLRAPIGQSIPPDPTSGIFPKAEPAREPSRAPDPIALAEEAKTITGLPIAAVLTFETPSVASRSVLATPGRLRVEPGFELLRWLARVSEPRTVRVPKAAVARMKTFAVVAVPMVTPILRAGVLAVPAMPDAARQIRRLESLATDFAMQAEISDRRSQLDALELADEYGVVWG